MDRPSLISRSKFAGRFKQTMLAALKPLVLSITIAAIYFAYSTGGSTGKIALTENDSSISELSGEQTPLKSNQVVAFVNVNLVPMDSERILSNQTVIVRDGLIAEIGETGKVKVPNDALRVDGRDKYLMPGLVDMHVHLRDYTESEMAALLELYVLNGVTTVLNLSGMPRHLELRGRVAKGELFGPTIFTAGPYISRTTGSSPTPEEVERAVIEQKQAGYDLIKIHGDFTREAYDKLFEVARREGRLVVGHSPRNLGYEAMIEKRQDAVAHAEEYIYDKTSSSRKPADLIPQLPSMARATAEAGTWLIPNLTAFKNIALQARDIEAIVNRPEMKYLPPRIAAMWGPDTNPYVARFKPDRYEPIMSLYRVMEKLTKVFHDSGVRLMAGTDAMNPSVVPGFSLHDELEDLNSAGLTPYQAIRAATANPAEFLRSQKFGVISKGKRADLLLVKGDPLKDVKNARKLAGIMVGKRWISEAEIGARLNKLVESYAK